LEGNRQITVVQKFSKAVLKIEQ